MAGVKEIGDKLIFGLDIGTRSIVGTVGYRKGDKFVVVAQEVIEHETRAMIDGQIHDIGKVGASIAKVRNNLERKLEQSLTSVCIAAAGRVLRTKNVMVEQEFSLELEVTKEEINSLNTKGVEVAFEQFIKENDLDMKFYCVGYSVMNYYLNEYGISNLEGHKAKKIGAKMIVTFLPEDVVDGLYKAVELAELEVENLTLEPIAAIQVAIPEKFRMLNIALIDVGAGTSDISITKDGAIIAYGMIPIAGDCLTEKIAGHCLVDFAMAEKIKRGIEMQETVSYEDILGLPQTITRNEVLDLIEPELEHMTQEVANCIKELNGDKSVSAVFIVGGGGKILGYTEKIAEKLELPKERVAIRGEQVMGMIEFLENDANKDSLMVTPIGICMNYYEHTNNFIVVDFNGETIKLYDNNKLTVADAAMHTKYPNLDLFPKRGKNLEFMVNGKSRIIRGTQGEAAVVHINEVVADLYAPIRGGDKIRIEPSSIGEEAKIELQKLKEYTECIQIMWEETLVSLPKYAMVNGTLKSGFYEIKQGDKIEFLNYYTLSQFLQVMDLEEGKETYLVNNAIANSETAIYENFVVKKANSNVMQEESIVVEEKEEMQEDTWSVEESGEEMIEEVAAEVVVEKQAPLYLSVIVNNKPVLLTGKTEYMLVDVFDVIDFDLAQPKGSGVVTTLNGVTAKYMDPIKEKDVIEIYWVD